MRVDWFSGVEPCSVLAGVDVVRDGNTFKLTVNEGSAAAPDTACIDIAMYKGTIVDLGELEPGHVHRHRVRRRPARDGDDRLTPPGRTNGWRRGCAASPILRGVNLFDLFAVVILVTAVLAGIRTGALPQVGGVLGALGGLLLVLAVAPLLLDATRSLDPIPRAVAVLGAILAAVVLGEALGSAAGPRRSPGSSDGACSRTWTGPPAGSSGRPRRSSSCGSRAGSSRPGRSRRSGGPRRSPWSSATSTASCRRRPRSSARSPGALDASGLPDVFVGLDPLPLPAVDTPTDPQAARIAKLATASTARISTRACDTPGQRHRHRRRAAATS